MRHLFNGIFHNKTILITGHTGFKGSWMTLLLNRLGAEIYGYALEPPTVPSLFKEARINELIHSHIADIRDFPQLLHFIQQAKPEIVIHMAAQPLVRESYRNPIETYSTNVMGTVNLLEAIRQTGGIKAVVNVTTDKCYENREWYWGYRETEPLGGFDPYSNSKGCSEMVTASFRSSFFNPNEFDKHKVALASARAGNVIGGGDWAQDRLIPDFIRSISKGEKLWIRNPYAIRPWQHVLEPLTGYLTLASRLLTDGHLFAQAWNFGPEDADAKNVEWITGAICNCWGEGAGYAIDANPHPHETSYLKLDCSKAKAELNWYPRWDIQKAIRSTVEWYKAWIGKRDVRSVCYSQMEQFFTEE